MNAPPKATIRGAAASQRPDCARCRAQRAGSKRCPEGKRPSAKHQASPDNRQARRNRHHRGVILLVAMVAVVALAFAGMALVRAVATSAAIGGNVNARQQAMYAATIAFEHDVVALFEDGVIDTTRDDPSHNYFASRQSGEDRRGVPRVLLSADDYPAGASVIDAGDGFVVRHVIERLCLLPGAASTDNCTLSPPSTQAATGTPPPGEPPREPAYRITMRVEGSGGVVAYAQAMLSLARPNPRLSWQVLDE